MFRLDDVILACLKKLFLRQAQRGYHDKILILVNRPGLNHRQIETPNGEAEYRYVESVPSDMIFLVEAKQWKRQSSGDWTNVARITFVTEPEKWSRNV